MAISYQRPAIGYQSNFRYQRNLNRNQKTMKAERLNAFDNQQKIVVLIAPLASLASLASLVEHEVRCCLAQLPLCGGNIVAARL